MLKAVADSVFPRYGGVKSGGAIYLLFGIIFAENCMKMKKELDRGNFSVTPPDPPLITDGEWHFRYIRPYQSENPDIFRKLQNSDYSVFGDLPSGSGGSKIFLRGAPTHKVGVLT